MSHQQLSFPGYMVPTGPYRFLSGKNKNRFLEEIFFTDPIRIVLMYRKICESPIKKEKNQIHKHLDWLISKAEKIKPKAICPHCGKNPVLYFKINLRRGGLIPTNDTACKECVSILVESLTIIREINYKDIASLYDPHMKLGAYEQSIPIFLWAYEIEQPISPQSLFELFQEA